VQRIRFLLIPGTICIGFLVNIPIISQSSTAVTLGAVAVPVLLAARLSPATVGAVLLLGSSIGGELLNPGAPELRTVATVSAQSARDQELGPLQLEGSDCARRNLPLDLLGLAAATLTFWLLAQRAE